MRVAAQAAALRAQLARDRLAWVAKQRRLLAARLGARATGLDHSASSGLSGVEEIRALLLPDGGDHGRDGAPDGDVGAVRFAVGAPSGEASP